jgi:integrase/recombinase XerD
VRVQRVLMQDSEFESWTLLGDDHRPVEPVERFLAYLASIEKSPNTIKAYAHDLKDWLTYLGGRGLDWQCATLEDVAGFVAWLRLPPAARDGKVAVLPSVEHHCSAASVNRKLAALTSFCEFHVRHGVELAGLLVMMQPAGQRGGSGTSYKPFLHHVTRNKPERRRVVKLKASRSQPKVLTAEQAQTILDACDHLRDRLLFAVLLDTGIFSTGPALWRRLIPRVCAAQRLMIERYRVQQVWCKWLVGFSPVGVGGVDTGHQFAVGGAGGGEVLVAFGEL